MENCWKIVEVLPIQVIIKPSWTGKSFQIIVPPMRISYERFLRLGDNLSREAMEYGGKMGLKYEGKTEKFPTDVSGNSYEYSNGEAIFSGTRVEDIKNWLSLYHQIVEVNTQKSDPTLLKLLEKSDKPSVLSPTESSFVDRMMTDLQVDQDGIRRKTALRKDHIEKIAASFGIEDKTEVKELTEFAIVRLCQGIVKSSGDTREAFSRLVEFYHSQPSLSHRSSMSTIYQQYSTPSPIAYLAGCYCKNGRDHLSVFEPSAGNGLLTIAFEPGQVSVNEIDPFRLKVLRQQPFKQVWNFDASKAQHFAPFSRKFDAIVSNPPFDKLDRDISFDGTPFGVLDHLMAALALSCMTDGGRAAIIVGGHTEYDDKGRIKAGKNRKFISYLWANYLVEDIININGDLYYKQGTSFNIRLILIRGRRPSPGGYPPLVQDMDPARREIANTFEQLYARVFDTQITPEKPYSAMKSEKAGIIGQGNDLKGDRKIYAYFYERNELIVNIKTGIESGLFSVVILPEQFSDGSFTVRLLKRGSAAGAGRAESQIIGQTKVLPPNGGENLEKEEILSLALPVISDQLHNTGVTLALRDRDFQKAIREKRMSASDAAIIIESAGLSVPVDIQAQLRPRLRPGDDELELAEMEAEAILLKMKMLQRKRG